MSSAGWMDRMDPRRYLYIVLAAQRKWSQYIMDDGVDDEQYVLRVDVT